MMLKIPSREKDSNAPSFRAKYGAYGGNLAWEENYGQPYLVLVR